MPDSRTCHRTMINRILEKREQAWLGDAELKVFHRDGVNCQREMKRMYASLSEGATSFTGTYYCETCDVAVGVQLRAHPDIPFEIFRVSGETVNE